MSIEKLVERVSEALKEGGCEGAQRAVGELREALTAPLDQEIRKALDALRSERCFALMVHLAQKATPLATMPLSAYVRRQHAQAAIELRDFDTAKSLLESVLQDLGPDDRSRERSEAAGLLGRMYKDRFVSAYEANGGSQEALEFLSASLANYASVFDLDPSWHGANLIALTVRNERDDLGVDAEPSQVWAQRLLDKLWERPEIEWRPWDYAAVADAYLALKDEQKVAKFFPKYWNAPGVDSFALAGTQRQLREIWQIDPGQTDNEFFKSLHTHLEARRVTVKGGGREYTVDELCRLAGDLQDATGTAEALFGTGAAVPIEQVLGLLENAQLVCRVGHRTSPGKSGTGFLVDGRELSDALAGKRYVLTNHHVLHGDELTDQLREHKNYRGAIPIKHAEAQFHYWNGDDQVRKAKLGEIVAHSPAHELDFALATVEGDLGSDHAVSLSTDKKPLRSRNFRKQRDKVFVVGHPEGKDSLSFSFSDNEVVDHELDDNAMTRRRIHYRAPTSPGSSGSPVLHHESLEVIGLHRAGAVPPLREDWPRDKPDEEYEANEAIAIRSIREKIAGT